MEEEKTDSGLAQAEEFGIKYADIVMEAAHMRYNAPSGQAIVRACIGSLQKEIGEFQLRESKLRCRKVPTRAEKFGMRLANVAIAAARLTGDAFVEIVIVKACIARLRERIDEIQAVPAEPAYKKARYDKKE